MPTRTVLCVDSFQWLKGREFPSIITSLPDSDDLGMSLEQWMPWFFKGLELCLSAAGMVIFYQTDRKARGATISKAALCMQAAHKSKHLLLWHKIALRREVGKVDMYRPTYSHLLCFGRNSGSGKASPDVIPPSESLSRNGMSIAATKVAVQFAKEKGCAKVCDPFCGRGTVLAVAGLHGLSSIGCDIDPACVEASKQVQINPTLF